MSSLLNYNLILALYLMVWYLGYRFVLSKDTNFKLNRYYLIAGMFISIVFTTGVFLEKLNTIIPRYSTMLSPVAVYAKSAGSQTLESVSGNYYLSVIFIIISALLILIFLSKLLYIVLLIGKNRIEHFHHYKLVKLNKNISPFSFFN